MFLNIEKVTYQGFGLSRTEDGKIVFIPYVLPNEKVKVKIKEDKKDYLVCEIEELIEVSPYRIKPICEIFGICGGCDFLNIEYDYELLLKKDILKEIFYRNHIPFDFENKSVFEIIKSPSRLYYRNNAQLKVSERGEIGFFKEKTLKVIPFKNDICFLLSQNIREYLKNINKDFLLFTKGFRIREGEGLFIKGLKGVNDSEIAIYKVKNYSYQIDIDGFFQVNNFTNPIFIDLTLNLVNDFEINNFVELYAGAGFFSIPIFKEKKIKNYFAYELSKKAIEFAKINNKNNNTNINFIAEDSEVAIEKHKNIDFLLVDPPRSGLTDRIINSIIDKKIRNIIYISCNPSTYARDVYKLIQNGYKIEKLFLLDNFPVTYHFEIISKVVL